MQERQTDSSAESKAATEAAVAAGVAAVVAEVRKNQGTAQRFIIDNGPTVVPGHPDTAGPGAGVIVSVG